MKKTLWTIAVIAVALTAGQSAMAEDTGWTLRAGPYGVLPKSNNGLDTDVDSGYTLGFTGTYMFNEKFGIDILASLPFSHDINDDISGEKIAETKHLPPTFTAQYHMPVSDTVDFFAGVGLNWTLFFDEETTGPATGVDIGLDDSIGLALQLGADFDINDNMLLNVDIRYIDIETDVELDGVGVGTVKIDPWVIGLNFGWRL